MRHVPSSIPAIGLLRHYINGLLDPKSPGIAGLEAVVATHIRDLVALVVGANRDGAYQSKSGGVMAARFQMAQHFIAENLLDPSLTDKSVAMALGISPRYLKKLFSGEGGFSNYLVGQRLNFAYRLLTNPLHIRTKVIDIAFRCGFSSLSTFNRRFKNYHGISPSEARLDFMGETDRNSHLPLD
jgi:AraC-like DNA-binding protein